MKKVILLISTFAITIAFSFAQQTSSSATYPYTEDFESSTFPQFGGSLSAAGWGQTAANTFSTYILHGTGNPASKGLTKNVSNFATTDSIISPPIGPLTATSVLSFDYRIVDYAGGQAATLPLLGTDFKISIVAEVSTIIGNIRIPLTEINSTNHTESLSFANKTISLPATATGQTGSLRIIVKRGTPPSAAFNSFYFDFDNISVSNSGTVGVNSLTSNDTKFSISNDSQNKSIRLISSNVISDVIVYGVDGKVVLNQKNYLSGENIQFNNSGIYIVQCNVNGTTQRKKIVIE